MIRLQLKCVHGDYFDAWFPDRESFDSQAAKFQVMCPHCGETNLAEAPPLKPGLYPELTEDQARQMASDTRRMLAEWMAAGGLNAVSTALAEQAGQIMPAQPTPAPVERPEAEAIDDAPKRRRHAERKAAQRALPYDC